ncbi:response regulator [Clostridium magnum]|nr:response regulator [Clostridium magnum]SHI15778.1 Two-component response regulator, SAPR family, consists of REC, wHTH and BTAD domains [Clostridium magnum DSM 2767]
MISAIVIDNDIEEGVKISKILEEKFNEQVKGIFTTNFDALEFLKSTEVDAVFFNSNISNINGMKFVSEMLNLHPELVVLFVTDYTEYEVKAHVLSGFKMNASEYLSKTPLKDRIINKYSVFSEIEKLNVFCFGKFRVMTDDKAEIKWRTAKTEELFAYFIASEGRTVTKEELIENVFGKFDANKASNNLKVCIHYLKKNLEAFGISGLIQNYNRGYKLNVDKIYCDYYELQSLALKNEKIDTSNIEKYEKISQLYCGNYLEGNYYDWSEHKMDYLQHLYIKTILLISEFYLNNKIHMKALEIMKKGLNTDFLNKEINEKIIEMYIKSGDKVSAKRHFCEYKLDYRKEFGVELEEDLSSSFTKGNL